MFIIKYNLSYLYYVLHEMEMNENMYVECGIFTFTCLKNHSDYCIKYGLE